MNTDVNKRSWTEIAEYASLAGSALGTVVAAVSNQVLYAATPLTFALALNLINRQRFQQETQHVTRRSIAQAYEAYQSLNKQVQALPAQVGDIRGIETQVATLQLQLKALDLNPIDRSISELQHQIDKLNQQKQNTPPVDLKPLEQRLNELEKKEQSLLVNHLVSEVNQLQSDKAATQGIIAQITQQLDTLAGRLDNLPTPNEVDLNGVEQAIADLKGQLNTLTRRFDNLPTPPAIDVSAVEQAIAELKGELNGLTLRLDKVPTSPADDMSGVFYELLADLKAELDSLNQQFNARPETQVVEQLGRANTQLTEQLNALGLRLDHLPTAPGCDMSGGNDAIADLKAQLDVLTLRLDNLPTATEVDLSGVEHE